ncbi:hypothetical protein [Actinoplanes teichomyceticus]|uniref:Uncharacterized protein n=1 Tax=Actinoplanes teichomyceticus TaxID=1867 RepID=A0A561WAR9_ACTTI|nr:hypothetical protein [Actinoplanes teichomyceticus]TWG20945.1 hypothetical protein FHX34_103474 [Actinoplanes teichomyceticus]GIF16531.1 hypothetical protein Ate01nite_65630 [Actinoplanes teichomyceticus]
MPHANPGPRSGFLGVDQGALQDNVTFLEWCEGARRVLHTGALELGIFASEADARFRKVSRGLVIANMSSVYRAHQVSKPIAQAAEALVAASRYIITASNRYQAVYLPELEAAGWRGNTSGPSHGFRAM